MRYIIIQTLCLNNIIYNYYANLKFQGPMEDQEEELDLDKMKEKKRVYEQHKQEEKRRRAKSINSSILKPSSKNKMETGDDDNNDDEAEEDGASWGFGRLA